VWVRYESVHGKETSTESILGEPRVRDQGLQARRTDTCKGSRALGPKGVHEYGIKGFRAQGSTRVWDQYLRRTRVRDEGPRAYRFRARMNLMQAVVVDSHRSGLAGRQALLDAQDSRGCILREQTRQSLLLDPISWLRGSGGGGRGAREIP
jgi:hypothetical protein